MRHNGANWKERNSREIVAIMATIQFARQALRLLANLAKTALIRQAQRDFRHYGGNSKRQLLPKHTPAFNATAASLCARAANQA
jgi:hypothetical protein